MARNEACPFPVTQPCLSWDPAIRQAPRPPAVLQKQISEFPKRHVLFICCSPKRLMVFRFQILSRVPTLLLSLWEYPNNAPIALFQGLLQLCAPLNALAETYSGTRGLRQATRLRVRSEDGFDCRERASENKTTEAGTSDILHIHMQIPASLKQ